MRPANHAEHTSHLKARREDLVKILSEFLDDDSRFVWEVGCGHGHFLTAYAKRDPAERCVGIDIASARIERACRKRDRGRLDHLHFIRADAEDFLAAMPQRSRFTGIFILFPDPWPKRRHHKNRVVTEGFLARVAGASVAGAPLYFRTDHEPYFRETEAIIRLHPDWRLERGFSWPVEEPTVFEKRAAGHFSLVATRR